jgi:hypothetical protein
LEKRERRRGVESPTPMVTPVTTASMELVLLKLVSLVKPPLLSSIVLFYPMCNNK